MEYFSIALDFSKRLILSASDVFSISPIDLLIVSILFLLIFGFGFQYGKRHVVALIVSLYIAATLFLFFPFMDRILALEVGDIQLALLVVGIFFIFYTFLYFVIYQMTAVSFPPRTGRRVFEAAVFAAVSTAFLIASAYHVLPVHTFYDFSAPLDDLFAPEQRFFWYLLAPLIALFFFGKRKRNLDFDE